MLRSWRTRIEMAVLIGLIGLAFWLVLNLGEVDKLNYHACFQVRPGMTIDEVSGILGREPDRWLLSANGGGYYWWQGTRVDILVSFDGPNGTVTRPAEYVVWKPSWAKEWLTFSRRFLGI